MTEMNLINNLSCLPISIVPLYSSIGFISLRDSYQSIRIVKITT